MDGTWKEKVVAEQSLELTEDGRRLKRGVDSNTVKMKLVELGSYYIFL